MDFSRIFRTRLEPQEWGVISVLEKLIVFDHLRAFQRAAGVPLATLSRYVKEKVGGV